MHPSQSLLIGLMVVFVVLAIVNVALASGFLSLLIYLIMLAIIVYFVVIAVDSFRSGDRR